MDKTLKDEILAGVVWENWPEIKKGGQQCGMSYRGFKLTHPEFNMEICCVEFKTQMQNRQMCLDLFELFLMERIKD